MGGGEGGGAYSVSNLHVKCWPGQLMGMRGIVRPMLFVPTLLQYLSRWLERYKNRHYLNDSHSQCNIYMYVTLNECGCFHCADCMAQPSQVCPLCHNQVVTRGCRIQSHPSPTESVLWHNDCYDNHHLKPRVGGGEMSASRLLL